MTSPELTPEWVSALDDFARDSRSERVVRGTVRDRVARLTEFAARQPDPWGPTPAQIQAWIWQRQRNSLDEHATYLALKTFYDWAHRTGRATTFPIETLVRWPDSGHRTGPLETLEPSHQLPKEPPVRPPELDRVRHLALPVLVQALRQGELRAGRAAATEMLVSAEFWLRRDEFLTLVELEGGAGDGAGDGLVATIRWQEAAALADRSLEEPRHVAVLRLACSLAGATPPSLSAAWSIEGMLAPLDRARAVSALQAFRRATAI